MATKKRKRLPIVAKIAFAVVAIYLAITLVNLRQQIKDGEAQNATLQATLAQQQQTNASLQEQADSELDNAEIAELARERLGLVFPGETIYYDVSN